ncbi:MULTISPECIES: succinate dehydrogenase cytochrome b subunit [Chryseobacterium]|jgi:succinate dehydrogenase / fumarate reductase cytochrome b subunit|uniref:Succinate dehydrogenase (Or fumarate reductase) cytochrome b subunit, b558 family n=1 Tax=Chryseobacterium indoltheticum TaxID=254 RepID=A0A381FMY5_9FLAO|nr:MULTISPECIES: succinate dehydrogenase cytochrome b subunit [Chryseobacterium]AZA62284.1 succinate dehydrogenase cytochrome b subunit [Chryseobacterium indoltheticum]AZA75670.1 succinate dehydrogenase cytochrome b subunit [Chryseobacterium indoltheticum]MDF2833353.1 succinate dehydrogenase [Chryseobacterium indoltheticum]MDQ8143456.1 succinate dehydrogenase cytochrome b subunit [Chryseobacterium sp. CFS15]QQQ27569.1 succinate dehydrogenase cytochrome b subunit [Chryseobacterium indoltheticum
MAGLTSSTIGRKYAMALSAMFLLIFLVMHLSVNLLSVFGETAYNNASQFMGYNPLIQFVMQPVLMFAVIFHFVMGFVLEIKNQRARPIGYDKNNGSANSTWSSRNMIISGAVILAFIFLHMYDFWLHEMNYKYVDGLPIEETRFWEDLHGKFADLWRVVLYVISFGLLGLHLAHGFQSSFQSIGARHAKYTPVIRAIGNWYSILIPLGFIFIAIFHYVTQ